MDNAAVERFLKHIWKGGIYGEIRNISRRGSSPTQDFYYAGSLSPSALGSPSLADKVAHANSIQYDVYFGVLPRTRRNGTSEDIPKNSRILWADFDYKAFPLGVDLVSHINKLPVPPDFIIDTGGGYHVYWTLDRLIPVDTAETIMRGIMKFHGSDKCWDRARIMRLPGTTNWKYGEGTVARFIKADYIKAHSPQAFVDYIYEVTRPVVESPKVAARPRTQDLSLPGWLKELIDDGVPNGTRSEQSFRVICQLIERGWTYDQILDVFESRPFGIGEKYHERNMGERWFNLTYNAARKSTERSLRS